ncbi:MAG: DUF882 domain-containing protein [Devosiaceae bacterium]|nr:DUF882 domain-containing protein [Devosiaceae bacterium]
MPIRLHIPGDIEIQAQKQQAYQLSGNNNQFQNWLTGIPFRKIPGWFFVFALVGLLTPGLFMSPADAQTRKLKIYFLHTGEKSTIAYKKNGRYLQAGLRKINFALRDWRRNEPTKMDPALLDLIWEIYRQSGAKGYINVVSAYRSPATNNMLRRRGRGVAKTSQHTLGKAIDFFLPGVKLSKLRRIGLIEQLGGVGYYPRSGSPFVHIDTGRVRHWPRMTRRELVRIFPRGNTLHVPTDGKPLKGYNKAVASYNSKKSSKSGRKLATAKGSEKQRKTFFQRLASLRNDDEGDTVSNNVPAPRKVRTTSKPADTNKTPSPGIPDKNPSQPVLPATNNTPVPRTVHRETVPVSNENTATAKLNDQKKLQEPEDNPVSELQVASIPVPAARPRYVPAPVLVAENQPVPEPVQVALDSQAESIAAISASDAPVSDTNEQLRIRLLAQAKAQLQKTPGSPPRPSAEVGTGFETAFLPTQNPAPANSNPVLTRSLTPSLAPQNVPAPNNNSETTAENPVDPFTIIPSRSPLAQNDREKTTDQSQYVLAFATDAPGTLSSPENLRARMEQQSQELAGTDTAGNNKGKTLQPEKSDDKISDIIQAVVPTPSPRHDIIKTASTPQIKPAVAMPVTEVASLDLPANKPDAKTLTAAPKPLDELSLAWYEQSRQGQFVLANSVTYEAASAMRAPAYGRAAIRQSPNTVLTAGFIPSGTVQHSSSFTGTAIRFQTFTRFN